MAQTDSVTAVIDQTSDAAFRTWIQEIITAFGTTLTLTQTADTGQINTATVTRPAVANTSAGFVIFRFNDTLQATSPIFIKLEFGTGTTATTSPNMWITVGTATNGAGTLTGTTTTRFQIVGGVAASNVTNYVSRYMYNSTQGMVWMSWKQGAIAGGTLGGFKLERANNLTGAAIGDAYTLITQGAATGPSAVGGSAQCYSYLTGALVTLGNGTVFAADPFAQTTTLFSGNIQDFPVWQATPVLGVSANHAICLAAEIPTGNTVVEALVGSTTHTFISCPPFYGATAPAGITGGNHLLLWDP